MRCCWLYAALVLLILTSACTRDAENSNGQKNGASETALTPVIIPPPPPAKTKAQWFRIEVDGDDGLVPFLLEVQQPLQPQSTVIVQNGGERLPREMTCKGTQCEVSFPVFAAALLLNFESEESLVGNWRTSDYFPQEIVPVTGVAVDSGDSKYRYVELSKPTVDISGKWVLSIKGVGPGKAEFVQKEDGTVTGWIIPANIGDVRYMVGRVDGKQVRLSTFDGLHAYNIELTVSADSKKLEGLWHFQSYWHYPVDGWRGKEPSLEDLHTLKMKPGKTRLKVPELKPLLGKPVIVDLYGTWCAACIDLMPALVDLHKKYQPEGLEVLSIAFEHGDDPEAMKQQVARFEKIYGITWHSAVRDVDELAAIIKDFDNATGFPITVFVDRSGNVQGLHSGFVSGAAKDDHAALLAKFDEFTQEILASKGNGAP